MVETATELVHDLREQMISQRFEELRQKWSKWRGRHPAATDLNNQFDRRASSERSFDFIRTTSPQIVIDPLLLSSHNRLIFKGWMLSSSIAMIWAADRSK
ncbi:hypothetical protein KIN20_024299 [Parelaphostrongylus tenuis]|uniref:Uncharacterized protein n=1 Tax=Parelaphostrongylus tenuis TaxID=148309 RepID=A0AAD5MY37_PARTN|nr:hypothetical protein KIN20_024299 [Parelaphostrongylus tenuis]